MTTIALGQNQNSSARRGTDIDRAGMDTMGRGILGESDQQYDNDQDEMAGCDRIQRDKRNFRNNNDLVEQNIIPYNPSISVPPTCFN